MRLAVLGGSFNPPHIGHFALADAVHAELGIDSILLVPTFISPLKSQENFASAEDRLEMLFRASAGSPFLSVSACELERGGISYTADTLRLVVQEHGAALSGKPALIVGVDWVSSFCKWQRAEEIVSIADIILARRPGFSAAFERMRAAGNQSGAPERILFPGMSKPASVFFADNLELAISSSDIRRRIAAGKSWHYLVPESVRSYIIERGLYVR